MNTFFQADWNLSEKRPLLVRCYGIRAASDLAPGLDLHSAVHLTLMLSGEVWECQNGETFLLKAGEILLTAPWEPHGMVRSDTGGERLLLTADPEALNRFLFFGADRLEKLYRIPPAERRNFLNRFPPPRKYWDELLALRKTPDTPERELHFWHAALGLFVEIVSRECPGTPDVSCRKIMPVLTHLGHDLLSVPEAARICGLSESHFAHLFQKTFGLPFARYERLYRLNNAVEELRRSHCGLKEAAEHWGFCDKNHFSRLCRKYLHSAPGG